VPSTHKKTWRDSLSIDMLLSAGSVLVVTQPSSEIPERLMNYPTLAYQAKRCCMDLASYFRDQINLDFSEFESRILFLLG
jgi:predicted metalloenzyme YecM